MSEDYIAGIRAERKRAISIIKELKEFWSEIVEFEYGTVQAINPDELISALNDPTVSSGVKIKESN